MVLKVLNKTGHIAWCPVRSNRTMIAVASNNSLVEHSAMPTLSGSACLDFASFSLGSDGRDFDTKVSLVVEDGTFRSLAWAGPDKDGDTANPLGVVAGGFCNGSTVLWSPHKIPQINNPTQDSTSFDEKPYRLATLPGNTSKPAAVNSLEFCPVKKSVLACGGADGSLSIVDLANISAVDRFDSADGRESVQTTCVGWNMCVPQIIATGVNTGSTFIWNLKQRKHSISFRDPAGRHRPSSISWLPNQATQLIVAYDDDSNPSLQMWDLRNVAYPFKDFPGHSKGILSTKFNPLDPELMLSCGKDNRTLCWTIIDSQPVIFTEFSTQQWNTEVEWSPNLPGLLAAASHTESTSVYSIQRLATNTSYVPKWYKKPAGVSMGFGGRMVSFSEARGAEIQIDVISTDPELVQRSAAFEHLLMQGDCASYCGKRMEDAADSHEQLTWSIVDLLFRRTDRRELVDRLGFDAKSILSKAETFLGRKPGEKLLQQEELADPNAHQLHQSGSMNAAFTEKLVDPGKFFEELGMSPTPEAAGSGTPSDNLFGGFSSGMTPAAVSQLRGFGELGLDAAQGGDGHKRRDGGRKSASAGEWSTGAELLIKSCLLIGNKAAAIDLCLASGRGGEALLLAATSNDATLWNATIEEYVKMSNEPYLKVLKCLSSGQLELLVQTAELAQWQEALALVCTYSHDDASFATLCELLGSRLEHEKFDIRAAVVCYLCAGNFPKTVSVWSNMTSTYGSFQRGLQEIVEKMAVLKAATGFTGTDPLMTRKVTQYAEILANSGRLTAAMRYLCIVGSDQGYDASFESTVLRDRIFNSAPEAMLVAGISAPQYPFGPYDLQYSAEMMQTQQQHQQQQHQQQQHQQQQHQHQQQHQQQQQPQQPQQSPAGSWYQTGSGSQGKLQPQSYRPSVGTPAPAPVAAPQMYGASPYYPSTQAPAGGAGMPPTGASSIPPAKSAGGGGGPWMGNTNPPSHAGAYGSNQPSHGAAPYAQALQPNRPSGTPQHPPMSSTMHQPPSAAGAANTAYGGVGGGTLSTPFSSAANASTAQPSMQQPGMAHNRPVAPAMNPMPTPQVPVNDQHVPPLSSYSPMNNAHRPAAARPPGAVTSTAPAVGAGITHPGMPVPWPIPTDTQQVGSMTSSTARDNQKIQAAAARVDASAPPMAAADLETVNRVLRTAAYQLSQVERNPKRTEDIRKRLSELNDRLAAREVSKCSQTSLLGFCTAFEVGDYATANRYQVEMTNSSDWTVHKNWMMALKRLLPR